jgi:uncharacterized protein YwbE
MAGTSQFTIGIGVSCSDGPVGRVSRVLYYPVAEKVTYLVVEPGDRRDRGRLVPLDLVDGAAGEIRLRCRRAEFDQLEHALQTRLIPATSGYAETGAGGGTPAQLITRDTIPPGQVDVREGDRVRATDGDIGRVQGLVIDAVSRQITHVLLQEGHLWGRKRVAIPIGAVAGSVGGIKLKLTKQEVQNLSRVTSFIAN